MMQSKNFYKLLILFSLILFFIFCSLILTFHNVLFSNNYLARFIINDKIIKNENNSNYYEYHKDIIDKHIALNREIIFPAEKYFTIKFESKNNINLENFLNKFYQLENTINKDMNERCIVLHNKIKNDKIYFEESVSFFFEIFSIDINKIYYEDLLKNKNYIFDNVINRCYFDKSISIIYLNKITFYEIGYFIKSFFFSNLNPNYLIKEFIFVFL